MKGVITRLKDVIMETKGNILQIKGVLTLLIGVITLLHFNSTNHIDSKKCLFSLSLLKLHLPVLVPVLLQGG